MEQRGELPEDFTVAVEVRDDLSKDQTLRIATVENLQRQNMTPLEEAGALTKLVHKGVTLDDVIAQTGLSATTIKRRLALNALCKEAKALLAKGGLTLSQAEALTLGGDEAQRSILEQIENGSEASAEDIKGTLLPPALLMIFRTASTNAGVISVSPECAGGPIRSTLRLSSEGIVRFRATKGTSLSRRWITAARRDREKADLSYESPCFQ